MPATLVPEDQIAPADPRPGPGSLTARFLRVLAAVGVEGALNAAFLLYLAWRNPTLYGAFMYGLAGAAIAYGVVEAGLHPSGEGLSATRTAPPESKAISDGRSRPPSRFT